jgi:hypothetical protein
MMDIQDTSAFRIILAHLKSSSKQDVLRFGYKYGNHCTKVSVKDNKVVFENILLYPKRKEITLKGCGKMQFNLDIIMFIVNLC